MCGLLRIVLVIMLALAVNPAGAAGAAPCIDEQTVYHAASGQANWHCDHCVVSVCPEMCAGVPVLCPGAHDLHVAGTGFKPIWVDDMPEGLRLPPYLTPPIG